MDFMIPTEAKMFQPSVWMTAGVRLVSAACLYIRFKKAIDTWFTSLFLQTCADVPQFDFFCTILYLRTYPVPFFSLFLPFPVPSFSFSCPSFLPIRLSMSKSFLPISFLSFLYYLALFFLSFPFLSFPFLSFPFLLPYPFLVPFLYISFSCSFHYQFHLPVFLASLSPYFSVLFLSISCPFHFQTVFHLSVFFPFCSVSSSYSSCHCTFHFLSLPFPFFCAFFHFQFPFIFQLAVFPSSLFRFLFCPIPFLKVFLSYSLPFIFHLLSSSFLPFYYLSRYLIFSFLFFVLIQGSFRHVLSSTSRAKAQKANPCSDLLSAWEQKCFSKIRFVYHHSHVFPFLLAEAVITLNVCWALAGLY